MLTDALRTATGMAPMVTMKGRVSTSAGPVRNAVYMRLHSLIPVNWRRAYLAPGALRKSTPQ